MKNLLIIFVLIFSLSAKAQAIVKYEEPFIGVKIYDRYEKGRPDTFFLAFFMQENYAHETEIVTGHFTYKEFRELKKYISAGLPYQHPHSVWGIETDGQICFVQFHKVNTPIRLIVTEELLKKVLEDYKAKK